MKDSPLVSVIILNYNGKRFLNKCLSSVLKTKYPQFEVVLVDNASTDQSLDLAKTFGSDKRLKIIINSQNMGFGPGNNVGFRHAMGEYIVFLNNDTYLDPNWLSALVDVMERDRTIGLAQSMILNMDGKTIQTAGWLISDYCVFIHPIGANEVNSTKFPDIFDVSYASGAAMITRKELVHEIGLFDPKYPFFYDDTLLAFKTWLAGDRVVTISKSKVYHVGGGTSSGFDTFFKDYRGTICLVSLIFDVYYNKLNLAKALLIFTFSSIKASIIEMIEHQKTIRFLANISAFFWIFRNLKYVWKNRLKYWSKARIDEKTLISKMIRIRIPTAIYLQPPRSKLLMTYLEKETRK